MQKSIYLILILKIALLLTVCLIYIKKLTKKNEIETIWYVGGKSGGHIIPLLGIFKENKKIHKSIFLTAATKTDFTVIKNFKSEIDNHIYLNLDAPPKIKSLKILTYFPSLLFSTIKTLYFFYKYLPNEIITTGSHIAIIPCFISYLLNIPINVYHLDSSLANSGKFINSYANKIFIFFDEIREEIKNSKELIKCNNLPIRFSKNNILDEYTAKKNLGIDFNKKVIFIIGGSQGSSDLNLIIKKSLEKINSDKIKNIFIIHQIGIHESKEIIEFYTKNKIDHIVFNYEWNLEKFYNASNLIISRAGSGAIAEILFFKKPSILIPLIGVARDHQLKNAIYVSKKFNFIKLIK